MELRNQNITATALTVALVVSHLTMPVTAVGVSTQNPSTAKPAQRPTIFVEDIIEQRDDDQRGIVVGEPRVYDDAMLQQMLQAAEARLASLQVIDQAEILKRLGAIAGASQQISSFGLSVQGAPLPNVTTTSRGATGATTGTGQFNASGQPTSSTLTTQSGLAAQDVATTRAPFGPPSVTAPAPTTTLPSSGFSVSSSDILNEQLQLTAEINGLRLMLAGDLSSHFIKRGNNSMTKLKTTLGFPITLIPDERFKDAVAVVEVEVERAGQALSTEPPSVTALLPREKTYNVAEITDRSTSIGGGVATQILGFSGSWVRGHKTYYLAQDQDTLAMSLHTDSRDKVGFMWEFRPVLGRRYVKGGLRQTFVQLGFPAPADAEEGEIGMVRVRTYWRRYDRKRGIHKELVPNSVSRRDISYEIPRYTLAVSPPAFTSNDLEDLGGGQVLVSLRGRFLPGTYVRVAASPLVNGTTRLLHEHSGIRFTAAIADLATKKVYLVSHDGTEVPLTLSGPCGVDQPLKDGEGKPIGEGTIKLAAIGEPSVTTLDETNSLVRVKVGFNQIPDAGGSAPMKTPQDLERFPAIVLTVGPRTFGYSELQRKGNELSAVVPTALLVANSKLTLQVLFPTEECRTDVPLAPFVAFSQIERLVLLEQGKDASKFLLFGNRLGGAEVVSPEGVKFKGVGNPPHNDTDTLRLLELTSAQMQSHKNLLLRRKDAQGNFERPFMVAVPVVDAKKPETPKAKERITVGSDEAVIEGEGMKELPKAFFRNQEITSKEIAEDGKSLRLLGLTRLGVTAAAATQPIVLEFKSGAKVTVNIEVVDTKGETVTK